MTTSKLSWDIQHAGRSWETDDELLARNEMIPVGARIEIHDGKLLFSDEDRLVLVAMLLEHLGLDAVITGIEVFGDALNQKVMRNDENSRDSAIDAEEDDRDKVSSIPAVLEWFSNNKDQQFDDADDSKELALSPGQRRKISKSIADYESPIRYVVFHRTTEDWKHYLNVEDGCYCNDLDSATAFKELSMARAVADTDTDLVLHIAQISIDGDSKTILADNCLPPVKKPFAQALTEIPSVGNAADFERQSRRNILRIKGENAFLRLILLAGGIMSAPEVSDLLGIETREVRDLRDQGKLIALLFDEDDVDYYPLFQFSCRKNEVGTIVNNFPETLALLKPDSPIDSVVFFLTPDIDLEWDAPIQALKKGENIELVRRLAKQFGRQAAK